MGHVVVIGSNSFSGSHYINFLLEHSSHQITGISRSAKKKDLYFPYKNTVNELTSKTGKYHVQFYPLDLNKDMTLLLRLLDQEKPAYVVNFASQSMVGQSWDHPDHWYKTNVLSTVRLAQHLQKQDYVKKYVHISTPEVYGSCSGSVTEDAHFKPSTPYAASRAAADQFIQLLVSQFNFPAVFTRAANVYGPGQQLFRIIPKSIVSMKKDTKIQLHGGGEARRSYIHINDVCDATRDVMEQAAPGEVYHLSTPQLHSVKEIVEKIASKLGKNITDVTETVETRRGLDAAYILDSSKAARDFMWKPRIDIDDGIDEVIEWVEQNWETIRQEPLDYIHKE